MNVTEPIQNGFWLSHIHKANDGTANGIESNRFVFTGSAFEMHFCRIRKEMWDNVCGTKQLLMYALKLMGLANMPLSPDHE